MTEESSAIVDDLHAIRQLVGDAPDSAALLPVGIREIVRGPAALESLGSVLEHLHVAHEGLVVVLADTVPKSRGGIDVLSIVRATLEARFRVTEVLVSAAGPASTVHADEATIVGTIERVRDLAPSLLVTVGSGTMADIGKVVSNTLSLGHVVVQTAASVNGFADDQSVLLINGAKRTTPSRWPDALVVDTTLLAEAPAAMNQSGLGDQLSMFTAAADWYLSNAVGFDHSFSSTLVTFMRQDFDRLVASAKGLGEGDPESVGILASFLTNGGMAMGMAGRTAPSSGTEHVISHLLEMHADAMGQPTSSHGSTVGVASVLASLAWQRVRQRLASGHAEIVVPGDEIRDRVYDAFDFLDSSGATANECWVAYERKLNWIRSHHDDLARAVDEWPAHDAVVEDLLADPASLVDVLRSATAPVDFSQLSPAPSPVIVAWACANCHLMRDRFTVVDLADLIGAWREDDVTALLTLQGELAR